jgi:hypothetical protein
MSTTEATNSPPTTGADGSARESSTAITMGAGSAAAGGTAGVLVGAVIGGIWGFLVGALLGMSIGESKGIWTAKGRRD